MKVLLLDDQREIRRAIRRMLARLADLEVFEADSCEAALAAAREQDIDLFIIDIHLSDSSDDRGGLEFLQELRRRGSNAAVMVVSFSSEIDHIREAMRLGARDYVLKDELCPELLVPKVEAFMQQFAVRKETAPPRDPVEPRAGTGTLVGSSAAMERVRRLVARIADSDTTVLLRGETGTGKEVVARALHEQSRRRGEPFVAVNCSAIPEELLESLLFGHERGSFTGADRRRRGRMEVAAGGTLLLDEIGDMPASLQAKLLRVLETGRYLPVGAEREMALRARVVAATHRPLETDIEQGRFRRDLFYRLNVVSITLPPLSERGSDVLELVELFMRSEPRRVHFTRDAQQWFLLRKWEGNIRELRNVLARVVLLAEEELVDLAVLEELTGVIVPNVERVAPPDATVGDLDRLVDAVLTLPDDVGPKLAWLERTLLARALERAGGNKTSAARLLGMHRKALERRWDRRSSPPGGDEDEDR